MLSLQVEGGVVLVDALVEAVEGSSPFGCHLVDEFRLLDEVDVFDALAEVALVDGAALHGLVDVLQLCEREEAWQQPEAQRLTMMLWSE